MKYIYLILFVASIGYSQSIEIKQKDNYVLWQIKNVKGQEVTRELVNLDNRLREREDFENPNGIDGSWYEERLYKGKWLIRIYVNNKPILQREIEVK